MKTPRSTARSFPNGRVRLRGTLKFSISWEKFTARRSLALPSKTCRTNGKSVPSVAAGQLIFRPPHNDREYRQLVKQLDRLVDEVGEDENHPLASMMEVIGVLIEKYEDEHVAELA